MMEPPPARRISGMADLVPRNTPLALMSMIRSQPSTVVSSTRPPALLTPPLPIPALLTRMSNLPNWETAAATALAQADSLVTSTLRNRASPPASPIWASTWRPSSSKTSPKTTLAPSRAKRLTSAAPMPLAPPLISATFPSSRPMVISLYRQSCPAASNNV